MQSTKCGFRQRAGEGARTTGRRSLQLALSVDERLRRCPVTLAGARGPPLLPHGQGRRLRQTESGRGRPAPGLCVVAPRPCGSLPPPRPASPPRRWAGTWVWGPGGEAAVVVPERHHRCAATLAGARGPQSLPSGRDRRQRLTKARTGVSVPRNDNVAVPPRFPAVHPKYLSAISSTSRICASGISRSKGGPVKAVKCARCAAAFA